MQDANCEIRSIYKRNKKQSIPDYNAFVSVNLATCSVSNGKKFDFCELPKNEFTYWIQTAYEIRRQKGNVATFLPVTGQVERKRKITRRTIRKIIGVRPGFQSPELARTPQVPNPRPTPRETLRPCTVSVDPILTPPASANRVHCNSRFAFCILHFSAQI